MNKTKHGCCHDRACTRETCMELPAGKECGDCEKYAYCAKMFGALIHETSCDWFPRRFKERSKVEQCTDWKVTAIETLTALRLINAHYDDLLKSNPGFRGKLVLQRYDLMNEAFIAVTKVLAKYQDVVPDKPS